MKTPDSGTQTEDTERQKLVEKLSELKAQDYYARLEVVRTASNDAINGAFRAANSFHPDKNPGALQGLYAQIFQLYSEAKTVLTNPDERKRYDIRLVSSAQSPRPEKSTYTPPPKPQPSPEEIATQSFLLFVRQKLENKSPRDVVPEISIKISELERQGLSKDKLLQASESVIINFLTNYMGRSLESWSFWLRDKKRRGQYISGISQDLSSLETLGMDKNRLHLVIERICLDFFVKFVSKELLKLVPEARDRYINDIMSDMVRVGVSKEKLEQSVQELLKF